MMCMNCQQKVEPDFSFCPHCGRPAASRRRGQSPSPFRGSLGIVAPVVALIGSFAPWLFVGLRGSVPWNVYHFGWFSALWLIADVAAIIWGFWWTIGKQGPRPTWMLRAWQVLGAMSFGVAVSSIVFVKVAGAVSAILAAPNPVRLGYGSIIFLAATAGWVVLIVVGYLDSTPAVGPPQ